MGKMTDGAITGAGSGSGLGACTVSLSGAFGTQTTAEPLDERPEEAILAQEGYDIAPRGSKCGIG